MNLSKLRITLEVWLVRLKFKLIRLLHLAGFGILLFGVYDIVSPLYLDEASNLLPALPSQTYIALTSVDDVLLMAVGAALVWVSTSTGRV